jgi:hypothetical protein
MLVYASTFSVPKRGCSQNEYEDAFLVSPEGGSDGEIDSESIRIAIADGASESLLAGRWARRLVQTIGTAIGSARTKPGFVGAYRDAIRAWDDEILGYAEERAKRGTPIQWYEEPGIAKGAHATIVVAEFRDGHHGRPPTLKAAGIGDSCLFQVRDESLYGSFPLSDASSFSYQPPLLSSRGAEDEILRRHIQLYAKDWENGDSFYFATDALAAWFLRAAEAGVQPWAPLRDLGSSDAELDFLGWVNERRNLGEMHDDDTTLIRIDIR